MIKEYLKWLRCSWKPEKATDLQYGFVLIAFIFAWWATATTLSLLMVCFVKFDFGLYNWAAVARFNVALFIPIIVHYFWWKHAKN